MSADAGPGGRPAGPPRVRVSDSDKDRLLAVLREHYALGSLDDADLDRRTGIVLSASYADEAAAAVLGLPALASQAPPPRAGGSRRRHAQSDRPGPGWVPTSERFRDPASGQVMRVWIDPVDDSRHYVPEPP